MINLSNYPTAEQTNSDTPATPTDFTQLGGYTADNSKNVTSLPANKGDKKPKEGEPLDTTKANYEKKEMLDDAEPYHANVYSGNGVDCVEKQLKSKLVSEATLNIDLNDLKSLLESTAEGEENEKFVAECLDIFKATINTLLDESVQRMTTAAVEVINEQVEARVEAEIETLEEDIGDYLDAVVLEWSQDNQLAIQESTRSVIAESFMADLKGLLEAYNIELPEDKVDLYESALETGQDICEKYDLVCVENEQLKAEIENTKKYVVTENFIGESSLSQTEAQKLRKVVKTLDFVTESDFEEKLALIAESYERQSRSNYVPEAVPQEALQEDFYDLTSDNAIVESDDIQGIDPLVAALAGKI